MSCRFWIEEKQDMNQYNDFELTIRHGMIFPYVPINIRTRNEAYRTASWLIYLADQLPEDDPSISFKDIFHEIAINK